MAWDSSASSTARRVRPDHNAIDAINNMLEWDNVWLAFLWNLNFNTSVPAHDEKWAFGILGRPAYDIVKNMQR